MDEYEHGFEGQIEQLVVDVHMALRDFKVAMAEPMLRLILECKIGPGDFGFDAKRLHECAKSTADFLASQFYSHWDGMFDALEDLQAKCTDCTANVHNKYEEASVEGSRAKREVAELTSRLVALQSKIKGRVQHNRADPRIRSAVLNMTGGKCAYCDQPISERGEDGKAKFEVEHVVPRSAGGPDHISNYVPACSTCNGQKAAGHVLEFIRKKASSA